MKLPFVVHLTWTGLALATGAGCAERAVEPQGKLALEVAPIALPNVGAACYNITVTHGDGETVWSATNICSDANIADNGATSSYGNGGPGGIAYFGTCVDDNVDGPAQNHVTVELTAVYAPDGSLMPGWVEPPPYEADVDCNESADTRVNASFVVLQEAAQGFLDLKVALDQIACSAKIDCVDDFYYPPASADRFLYGGSAVVVALSCNATDDSFTNLYMDLIGVTCDGTTFWIDPITGPGNSGQSNAFVTDAMVSEGVYQDGKTSYWVTTIGFDTNADYQSCSLTGVRMTASSSSTAFSFSNYESYPVIDLAEDIPIYDQWNGFGCQNPLNGQDGSLLVTDYANGHDLDTVNAVFQSCLVQDNASDSGVRTDECTYSKSLYE